MNSATNVHHNLQGAVIPSSGSVGMRIQYPFLISIVMVSFCIMVAIYFGATFFYYLNFLLLSRSFYLIAFAFVCMYVVQFLLYRLNMVHLLNLTSKYIFKESIWKKKGFWPCNCFSCGKWSTNCPDLPVA